MDRLVYWYCHPEHAKDIKPHKYVLSLLQSITLSIPMQQGKARSHGKGAREKGAKERGQRSKGLPQPGNQYTTIAVTNNVSNSKIKRNTIQGNRVDCIITN